MRNTGLLLLLMLSIIVAVYAARGRGDNTTLLRDSVASHERTLGNLNEAIKLANQLADERDQWRERARKCAMKTEKSLEENHD